MCILNILYVELAGLECEKTQRVFTAYERTLGKSHQMTRQAKLTLDNVQQRQQEFASQ